MSEWQKVKLGEIANYVNEKIDIKAFDTSLYISTDSMLKDKGGIGTPESIPESGKVTKYQHNDILVSNIRPYFKKIWFSNREGGCSNDVLVFRAKDNIDSTFLYYVLSDDSFFDHMMSSANGTKMPRGNRKLIPYFEIPLPPLATQHRITTILSRYDSLIENYHKQIKLLEEAAQRLYKEWFVDLRFPGHENTKIIDGVPEGWELKSVTNNHLFNVAKCPIALFNGNKTYYATADVEGTYFCNSGVKIEYDNKPSRAQIQPSLYSVWFARMSNSFKIVGFVEQNNNRREDSILSSGFAGFESHYERFGFLYCLISSQWFNDQKNRYATGATQVSITNEGLSRIRCILPTTRLAEEFSLVTNKIIEETILYRENCIMLAESRDRLLPKLMSGEIEI